MKRINIILLAWLTIVLSLPIEVSAENLIIEADREYQINSSQQVLSLEKLIIGDNARIVFADDGRNWSLNAKHVVIGNNVIIHARGISGEAGQAGETWGQKPDCGDGANGGRGSDGSDGSAGLNLTLNLGIQSIGQLIIDVSGGNGGDGGNGGKGEDAGFGKTCLRAHGGNGSDGGKGGKGGDGGQLRLSLRSLDENNSMSQMTQRITISTEFGEGGNGGIGGAQGKGSPSQVSNIPSASGARRRTHAGKNGEAGIAGKDGLAGNNGSISMNTLIDSPPPDSSNPTSDDRETEIQLLRQQLEALQKRLDQLEQR